MSKKEQGTTGHESAVDKQRWRTQLRERRGSLTSREIQQKSQAITETAKTLVDWRTIATLHCFETIEQLHEIDTAPLFYYLWHEQPHINVFTSRKQDYSGWEVQPLFVGNDQAGFKPDVFIVPILGFSPDLHRLGYGGGYYDRLLAEYPNAYKVGLCFEQGRLTELPVEPHDIAMDVIVTEEGPNYNQTL